MYRCNVHMHTNAMRAAATLPQKLRRQRRPLPIPSPKERHYLVAKRN